MEKTSRTLERLCRKYSTNPEGYKELRKKRKKELRVIQKAKRMRNKANRDASKSTKTKKK